MSSIASVQNIKTATCPHGLPPGACPICNGGGGGMQRRPANEWSWEKCYSVGQMMRAQQASQLESKQMLQARMVSFVENAQRILNIIQNSLPPQLQQVFSAIVKNVLNPLLNMIQKLPLVVNDIKNKIIDISEKLAALLGEIKNFVDRRLINSLKKLTKKFLSFFIWGDEELPYDDEELEIFKRKELSKIKKALLKLKRMKE